jgi:hypothetical protein
MLALCNLALCAIALVIAYGEGRMTHGQLGPFSIPYIWHGGIWADWTVITAVCYIAGQYANRWTSHDILVCVTVSAVLSAIMHVAYCYVCPIAGHLVDPRLGTGLARLTWGGWYHALYFVGVLSVILLFYLYTPDAPRLAMSLALTAFVPLAVWQPGWYTAKVMSLTNTGHIDAAGWVQAIAIWAVVWIVGYGRCFFGPLKP